MSNTIRVAAAQFQIGNDVDANLETCLRMLRESAQHEPDLVVLPEFANHCSWYDDAAHCYDVSVEIDGPFLSAIADCAREIDAHVVINCTVRRENKKVTGTSLMYGPDGVLLGETNKQVLIGHENDFLERATEAGPIIETKLGKLGMYSCMDGVINETPRCLALRGAQILCNSLNSFAIDEGNLHIPVRAAENKVWVVAANKVGPLIPEAIVEPVSQAINIPAHMLDGAGDSQVVAPDGTVLALAGKGEEIVFADIDPSLADDKSRPDGTDLFASRRPELYASLGDDPAGQSLDISGPEDVVAAAVTSIEQIAEAEAAGAKLICLAADSPADVESVQAGIGGDALVAFARSDGSTCLVANDAVLIEQALLHSTNGAESVAVADTEFGRIAVMSDRDAIFPETMRLASMQSVSTVLIPANLQENWEGRTGIVERAAENRVNIVCASALEGERSSLIASLQKDFTIMTEWKEREFDGLLSAPVVHRTDATTAPLVAAIHPAAASNKECSSNTHLIASRPWQLLHPITSTD